MSVLEEVEGIMNEPFANTKAFRELRDCIAEFEIMNRQLKEVARQNGYDDVLVKLVNDSVYPTLKRLRDLLNHLGEWNESVAVLAQNKMHQIELERVKAEAEINWKGVLTIKEKINQALQDRIETLQTQLKVLIDSNPPTTTEWGSWWREIPMEEREGYIKGLYQADLLIESTEKMP